MTDNITAQDRRLALRWCGMLGDSTHHEEAAATRRIILATVEAPAPSLAEELRHIAEHWEEWATDTITSAIRAAADRADQTEQERDEARADVKRLTAERTSKESLQVDQPAPADVKPGEAWAANIWYGDEQYSGIAIKSAGGDWNVCRDEGTHSTYRMNEYVELIARLVPAPRVITNHDELEKLAEGTIILARSGEACQKADAGDWAIAGIDGAVGYGPRQVLPTTVLWEPDTP